MSISQKEKLQKQLTRQIERINRKLVKLNDWSTRFSYIRLAYFIAVSVLLYFASKVVTDLLFFMLLFLFLGGFYLLVVRHSKIRKAIESFEALKNLKEQQIARMNLDWQNLSEYKLSFNIKNHPFADDLMVTGEKSLHHLVDISMYEGSSGKLAAWLLEEHPNLASIKKRQELIKELKPLNLFRNRLLVKAALSTKDVSDKDWSMEQLLKWMRKPKKMNFILPFVALSLLSLMNVVLAILAIAGAAGPYFLITLVTYLGIYNFNSHKISGLFNASFQINKQLGRFGEILLYVERFQFPKGSKIAEFCKIFKNHKESPSTYLRKAKKLGGAASLQRNQVLWPLVNLVIPWDMFFSMKMEKLKVELEPKLTVWLDRFYELEALNSLANFAAINPHYTFAEIINTPDEILFEAKGLGHPLIKDSDKVTNDFSVSEEKDLFLITGSNMAGKSTFLRTVGINLCLAFAGAPVNANQLNTRLFRLFTSINVKDSLGEGLSHFYAEVRRLKLLLDKLTMDRELPLFFFVDEIFKGTNNRERFQGSTAFLKEVAGKNGIGMVSTHDLELANLEKEISQLSNWHFVETIENGKMHFEYKIQSGPCPTTNALKIMELEGLPI